VSTAPIERKTPLWQCMFLEIRAAILLVIAAWLTGCAVGPNYHAPDTELPSHYIANSSSATTADAAVDPSRWWRALHDSQLDALIEEAVRGNPDIRVALTHLQAARAQEAGYASASLPSVAASAAGGRGTGSDLTRAGAAPPLHQADNKGALNQIRQVAGFSASWELDLFGGYRREIEAGRYDVDAAAAARNVVLISVIADVARNYIQMRGLQARVAITVNNIAAATQSRDLQQAQFDRGITNELDLQLANREVETLRAGLPLLRSEISARQYNIAVLLGRYPEDLANELQKPGTLPAVPEPVGAGLPLDLLRRRPDVRAAERNLAAATARIGVATASLFPHVSLAGGLGTQSDSIGTRGSHIWAFGPSVYWPLLDFGALDARVSVADLEAQARLITYKKTVVAAVQDADTAIDDFSAQHERLQSLGNALSASERAVSLAQQRYERGLTDFLNVVDAEHEQFTLEDEYTASQQSAAEAFIHSCLALGGGWESYQELPPIRHPEPAVIAALHRIATNDNQR
jgi:NodT family efflux transporter outer membrane factor (OMF) lipoprotein